MFLLNGSPLPLDTPFQIDGTSYPANWLRLTSLEEKNAVGITEVEDQTTQYDDRFYWGADNPKDLNVLKSNWIITIKDITNKLLSQTDWMIIRKIERNIDVSTATTAYRTAVIAECSRLVATITDCVDVPALITVVTTQDWPTNE